MKISVLFVLVLFAPFLLAQQYAVTGSIPLDGNGAWDYLKADVESRRLYVSHSNQVAVIDLDSQKPIVKLTGFGFIHSIVPVPALHTGFLTDGDKNEVIAFDLTTLAVKQRIETLPGPNGMVYDGSTGRLFVGHKPSQSITVITAATGHIEGIIHPGGKPEFSVSDGLGNIYVNIEDRNEVVQIDSKSIIINAHWPLAPCVGPSGLAIDTKQRRLFAACGNNRMVIVNADSGKLLDTLAIGEGPDAAGFDPTTRLVFSSNGDGTLTVIADKGNGRYEVVQNLQTQKGARTMALDTRTHTIYLSVAKLGPPPTPTPQNPHPASHPTAMDGTFKVLIVRPAGH